MVLDCGSGEYPTSTHRCDTNLSPVFTTSHNVSTQQLNRSCVPCPLIKDKVSFCSAPALKPLLASAKERPKRHLHYFPLTPYLLEVTSGSSEPSLSSWSEGGQLLPGSVAWYSRRGNLGVAWAVAWRCLALPEVYLDT